MTAVFDIEQAVKARYAAGAQREEAALCCPVEYNPRFLTPIPEEILERDYGCGDPSQHLQPGETVLDLGAGRRQNLLYRRPGRWGRRSGYRR